MLKRKFGWTNIDVPVIGMGTWEIEGSSHAANRLAIEALQLGLDLGMTHIDTAEMYGNGLVEKLVAKAIVDRRNEIFLVSKVWPSHASYEGTIKACKQSLERLKTDWIDLYLLHWPTSRYPIKETMRAMERLVEEGRIKFIGVSNFDVQRLEAAEKALSSHRIACNQVQYNLNNRSIEQELLPFCSKRQIAIVGYSPFSHGNLPSSDSKGGNVLVRIAHEHGRTIRQVILKFLTRDPNIFMIPKAGRPGHVRENSGGLEAWNLTDNDINALDHAFPVSQNSWSLEMV